MTVRLDKPFWIGVDVSKESLEVSVVPMDTPPSQWRQIKVHAFKHAREGADALIATITELADLSLCKGVCIESTGCYSRRLVKLLRGCGLPGVSIVNPARSVQFARSCGVRNKTDRVDAVMLGLYGIIHAPAPAPEPSPALQLLRDLDRARLALVDTCTAMKCRLEQFQDASEVAAVYSGVIAELEARIEALDARLQSIALEDETLRRQIDLLMTIPGIKKVSAITITVELGDLGRYSREEIVGAAGLFARQHESGTSVRRRTRLARGGGRRVRRVTYMGCTSLFQCVDNPLANFGRALIARGKSAMCALGAMMRKMLLIARAVVISGKPYDAALAGRTKPAQMLAKTVSQSQQEASAMP